MNVVENEVDVVDLDVEVGVDDLIGDSFEFEDEVEVEGLVVEGGERVES